MFGMEIAINWEGSPSCVWYNQLVTSLSGKNKVWKSRSTFIKEKALTVIISEYSTLHIHCQTLLTYLAGMRMKTNGMKCSAYGLLAPSYVHEDRPWVCLQRIIYCVTGDVSPCHEWSHSVTQILGVKWGSGDSGSSALVSGATDETEGGRGICSRLQSAAATIGSPTWCDLSTPAPAQPGTQ